MGTSITPSEHIERERLYGGKIVARECSAFGNVQWFMKE